jgi:hypothetical protein
MNASRSHCTKHNLYSYLYKHILSNDYAPGNPPYDLVQV